MCAKSIHHTVSKKSTSKVSFWSKLMMPFLTCSRAFSSYLVEALVMIDIGVCCLGAGLRGPSGGCPEGMAGEGQGKVGLPLSLSQP